jgi:hypothetical protein
VAVAFDGGLLDDARRVFGADFASPASSLSSAVFRFRFAGAVSAGGGASGFALGAREERLGGIAGVEERV